MKPLIICAALLAMLTAPALSSGPRDQCGTSDNAACLEQQTTKAKKASSGSYGSGAARRGACRMSGTC